MSNTVKNYNKSAVELRKLEQLRQQLREQKKKLVNSDDYKSVKRQEDNKKKKYWNKAHNTSAKLFRDMSVDTVNKIKNIVSNDQKTMIDVIVSNLKQYQGR